MFNNREAFIVQSLLEVIQVCSLKITAPQTQKVSLVTAISESFPHEVFLFARQWNNMLAAICISPDLTNEWLPV